MKKYFGEIEKGQEISPLEKQPVVLERTKKLYYEDNFANLPELTMAWPSVHSYHPDSFALDILANYLSEGKNAPFYQVLVKEKKLAPGLGMFNYSSEMAGQFMLQVRAYEETDLDKVAEGIEEAFKRFENNGISEKDLKRIKAGQETNFYRGLSSVLGKGFQLAQYQIYTSDPGFINKEVDKILAVTPEDVMRVYNKYIKDKNYVATSFVPKGRVALSLENSVEAEVEEEEIIMGAEEEFELGEEVAYEKTYSSFDRSVEPPYGEAPEIKVPEIWEETLVSGMEIHGITQSEVPLVQFMLEIKGGMLLEDTTKIGTSNLLAELLTKGTASKTPQELEATIELLGANINVNAGEEQIILSGSTLARNFEETMDLVKEILLQPRWDKDEFELAKQQVSSRIKQQQVNPNSIADNQFRKLIYGEDHILSHNTLGTEASLERISIEDLKEYYRNYLAPNLASFLIVGDIEREKAISEIKEIAKNWEVKKVDFPELQNSEPIEKSVVYFYDVPGAKQSEIRMGNLALAKTHPDYFPAEIMNYRLGGGGFASQLTQELREGKGYTYGIRSSFRGSNIPGPFVISTGVRSNISLEAVQLIKEILEEYSDSFNAKDLEVSQGFLVKSNAREFETLSSKLDILRNISNFNRPHDYVKKQQEIVENISVEEIKALAKKYVDPEKMIYLIVGDAKTQMQQLSELGLGEPVLLNK